jgi:hypothetical protein
MGLFQSITPVKLGQVAIGTANTLVYTVPAATRTFLKDIDIANTMSIPISVTVYAGAGQASANVLIPNVPIPANSIFQWTGSQILNTTDTINAVASATGCTISASGGEAA